MIRQMWGVVLALGALLALGPAAAATEVAGVEFPPTVRVADQELQLNGAGLRRKLFFKVYAAGLYLPQTAAEAEAVLAMAGPKRIQIHALRDLTRDQLVGALQEGLAANASAAEQLALEARRARFAGFFTDGAAGDTLTLDYVPGLGTRMLTNGEPVGSIEGEDFYRALLRVWLGEQPADGSLKQDLLGR